VRGCSLNAMEPRLTMQPSPDMLPHLSSRASLPDQGASSRNYLSRREKIGTVLSEPLQELGAALQSAESGRFSVCWCSFGVGIDELRQTLFHHRFVAQYPCLQRMSQCCPPLASLSLMSAPHSRRSLMTSNFLYRAAQCGADMPFLVSCLSISSPGESSLNPTSRMRQ